MKRFIVFMLTGIILALSTFFIAQDFFFRINPNVSVIIIGRNMETTLPQAVDSVLQQSLFDWELLIVNDASTDKTSQIISKYIKSDNRIFGINNEQELGRGLNLNQIISFAKGKYLIFLDPTDTAAPDRLARQVLFMDKNNLDLSAGQFATIDLQKKVQTLHSDDNLEQNQLGLLLLEQNIFPYATAAVRRDFLDRNNLNFKREYKNAPDYDLWLNMFLNKARLGLMGGAPITIHDPVIQGKEWWEITQAEQDKARYETLKKIHFEHPENVEMLPTCDFYNKLVTANQTAEIFDPVFLNTFTLRQCVPTLTFVHAAWKDKLLPIGEKNTFKRSNGNDTATATYAPNGITLKWDQWGGVSEYFKCEKNICTHAVIVEPLPYKSLEIHETDLHVFIEGYATNPALLQMIQYAQLPRQIRKIIAWHRFPNRSSEINLALNNTREVLLLDGEGWWVDTTKRVLRATKEELDKDPRLKLVLHANMTKYDTVMRLFLEEIPKDRIRHIHLYEDGAGELFKWKEGLTKKVSQETIQKAINKQEKWETYMIFGLHHFYPTTIYLLGYKEALQLPQYSKLLANVKGADIQNVSFDEYKELLSPKEKNVVYHLLGFDYDYWANLLKNKKSLMFVMGYYFGNKNAENAERNFLKRLMTDPVFSGIQASEYIWLYKPHPSYHAATSIADMRKNFPTLIEVPAQIPFEVFVLADLKPTKTTGYSSSLFYALHQPDILYYIRRGKNDPYLHFLQEVRHLKDNQILNLNEFVK